MQMLADSKISSEEGAGIRKKKEKLLVGRKKKKENGLTLLVLLVLALQRSLEKEA